VPGLGEAIVLEGLRELICGVRMHAHTTAAGAAIFP
jgi:hypothetical protein